MKARYTGALNDEDNRPRRVGFAGKSFPRDHFVDVSDIPDKLKAKLAANGSFDVSEDPMTKDEIAALEAVNGGPDEPGEGAAPPAGAGDKASVIAALEALQAKHPEVKFNPRSPVAKLQEVLEAAQFEHGDDE